MTRQVYSMPSSTRMLQLMELMLFYLVKPCLNFSISIIQMIAIKDNNNEGVRKQGKFK